MFHFASPFAIYRSLCAVLFIGLTTLACAQPAELKHVRSPAAQKAQEDISFKYAKYYIDTKNFEEATRFVDAIAPDSARANEAALLRKDIDRLIAEYDAALIKRYTDEDKVAINLSADLHSADGVDLLVTGKALLPPKTRFTVSLWQEESPNNWQKVAEELTDIGSGSNFQAILSPFRKKQILREDWENFYKKNLEVRINSYFRAANDQPNSVLKAVGEKGAKVSGEWVEGKEDGNFVNYHQRFLVKTDTSHTPAPDSLHCARVQIQKL